MSPVSFINCPIYRRYSRHKFPTTKTDFPDSDSDPKQLKVCWGENFALQFDVLIPTRTGQFCGWIANNLQVEYLLIQSMKFGNKSLSEGRFSLWHFESQSHESGADFIGVSGKVNQPAASNKHKWLPSNPISLNNYRVCLTISFYDRDMTLNSLVTSLEWRNSCK